MSVFGIARDLNSVHKTNLDLDICPDNFEELIFDFKNDDYKFLPKYFIFKIEIDKPKEYKPYLESYFKDLKIPKIIFLLTYLIILRMKLVNQLIVMNLKK